MGEQFLSPRGQGGQALVFIAVMTIVILGAMGLAIDVGVGYYYANTAQKAAAAGALAGVVFMPNQFSSVPSRYDATDRALDEAGRNGYQNGVNGVTVAAVPAPSNPSDLQVTVGRNVPAFFTAIFGVSSFHVGRTAVASQLSPILLGQKGSQFGSTVSELGNNGSYYFARAAGWATPRDHGDGYGTDPCAAWDSGDLPVTNCTTDVHAINGSTEYAADPSLPARGGYNYQINLPSGGGIQVYNAAYAPDDGNLNQCENRMPGGVGGMTPCNTNGGRFSMHENDDGAFLDAATAPAMRYTVFRVANPYLRSLDTKLTQMTVYPINAKDWDKSPPRYRSIVSGGVIPQFYDGAGNPINGRYYHAWMDVSAYPVIPLVDGGIVSYCSPGCGPLTGPGPLPPGIYRLRVDEIPAVDGVCLPGSAPKPGLGPCNTGTFRGLKGYAVRAVDSGGALCVGCVVSPMRDMQIYKPFRTSGSDNAFQIPLFQLTKGYVGSTVLVDIWDPGDISCATCDNILSLIAPGPGCPADSITACAAYIAPTPVKVYNCGRQRLSCDCINQAAVCPTGPKPTPNSDFAPNVASAYAVRAGAQLLGGSWLEFQVPIGDLPAVADPFWKLQYQLTSAALAHDDITFTVRLKGTPAHLLSG